ncbi:MAG TPA: N-acetyltransferase, partial [Ktedonobacter sp.]|nr:N-acetyltransferase [Ktedonobacter sp.]
MPFGTWWRGDSLPKLAPLPTFSANTSNDIPLLSQLAHLTEQEVQNRIQKGNRPYIAFMGETATAYGWVATRMSGIAELQFSFDIPSGNLYLWDFLTLPQWRGQGIYPHLLQAIIEQEHATQRFWIG